MLAASPDVQSGVVEEAEKNPKTGFGKTEDGSGVCCGSGVPLCAYPDILDQARNVQL